MQSYLELYSETYIETADKFLPREHRSELARYPFILGETIGAVSQSFGAGFEYTGASEHRIEVRTAWKRVEEMIFETPSRVSRLRTFITIAGEGVKFVGEGTIEGGFPFRLANRNASVTLIGPFLRSSGWGKQIKFAEMYGNRDQQFWSREQAVSRAKDEILQAQIDIAELRKRAISLADYLSNFKERLVLVLGDYSSKGRKRLSDIKLIIETLGYAPILLDEVPEDLHYDLQQKAVAVASVARFVVVDNSSASGHLVEIAHVQDNRLVTIILTMEGEHPSFMTRGISATSTVIREQSYNTDNLHRVLSDAVKWAEERIKVLAEFYVGTYPWRASTIETERQ